MITIMSIGTKRFTHIEKTKKSELQIRGGIDNNSDNFSYFSNKTCCDPSLETSRRDGSNGG